MIRVNADKPERWKSDVAQSIDYYNEWFKRFAPEAYKQERDAAIEAVRRTFELTSALTRIDMHTVRQTPDMVSILRMATAPPLARDRVAGLADIPKTFIDAVEIDKRLPARMSDEQIALYLHRIIGLTVKLIDDGICVWRKSNIAPSSIDIERAITVIADRLCGARADPVIRNEQERRQLRLIGEWLVKRGYREIPSGVGATLVTMQPGTFTFRLNVPVTIGVNDQKVNIPIDAVINPLHPIPGDLPILIEAKSAGDFTNTNKRRKEEATKMAQLRAMYGEGVRFILFLCGYFNTGYLTYEAAEGIDWVWEHRLDDLALLGM